MSVVVPNHAQAYRPLRGGIAIMNPFVGELGTLGMIVTSDGTDRWLLSALHVLAPPTGATDGQPIYQPVRGGSETPIAVTQSDRVSTTFDAAAALVDDGIDSVTEVLQFGSVLGVSSPAAGMRVVKSGLATGVTEGVIESVTGSWVQIRVLPGFPSKYQLSEPGDSGSIWINQATGRAVALHVTGSDTGVEVAWARPLTEVLAGLRLMPILQT